MTEVKHLLVQQANNLKYLNCTEMLLHNHNVNDKHQITARNKHQCKYLGNYDLVYRWQK